MATFFSVYTRSSLSLLLLLLSLSTGDLFLRADAAAVDTVCSKTTQPPLCKTLFVSTDTRSPTATLPVLGEIAIAGARDSAGEIKIEVQNLIVTARDPKLKSLYRNCVNLYNDALDQLLVAGDYIQKRQYRKLVAAAGLVRRGYSGCAAVVSNNGQLKQRNENARILADAIVVIVKNLK